MARFALEMSERFRQQIKDAGLLEVASLLRNGTRELRAVSAEIASALKPAAQEYRGIASTITRELAQLAAAARLIDEHNRRLMTQERSRGWRWQAVAAVALLSVGLLGGI